MKDFDSDNTPRVKSTVASGAYRHPQLGTVRVTARSRSHRMSASWVGPEVRVNIPSGMSPADYERILESWVPGLLRVRPSSASIGSTVEAPGLKVEIVAGEPRRGYSETIRLSAPAGDVCAFRIVVSRGLIEAHGAGSDTVRDFVNRSLLSVARHVAPGLLLPRARALAAAVGHSPLAWELTSNRRVLGTCTSRGIIRLSARCVFLPAELRDYVICHELAHLSEMNHSPRFHRLCDAYCGGREAELVADLKRFKFPVF